MANPDLPLRRGMPLDRLTRDAASTRAAAPTFDDVLDGELDDEFYEDGGGDGEPKRRKPLLKRFWFWFPVAIVLVLIAAAAVAFTLGSKVLDRAYTARDALEEAIPLASVVKDQIVDGDSEGARATADQLATLTAHAREQTNDPLWSFGESLPVAGNNLIAVRTVAEVVDDIVTDAVVPAAGLSLSSIAPAGGRIDTAAITAASGIVDQASQALDHARTALDGIDRVGLVGQVSDGVDRLDDVIAQLEPFIGPAQHALAVLPGLLGEDAPRNYLVLVQNNAESRGTGGNPAALVMLHVDNGAISIGQQASSLDFNNGRTYPITDLDPQTVALYGDKVGRFMMDVTETPDFTESARIMGAFWDETFGTHIDGTVSIDPVALGYLLAATGPVTLPTGDVLTAENAVPLLLNEVYFRYPDYEDQDTFFALAAAGVFGALTSVSDVKSFAGQVVRAVDEGRILYVPTDPQQAEYIAGSRLTGRLPADNIERTMLGVYVNDITEGKLDYYLDLAVGVDTDVCTATGSPTFSVTSTLTSGLQWDAVDGLAEYISPGNYFPKGVISTDLVLYGPVGASFVSATLDGQPAEAVVVEHLGRPAVKVNVVNDPASAHTVNVVFAGAEGVAGAEYGAVEAWHTPMVRDTPVQLNAPGCPAQ